MPPKVSNDSSADSESRGNRWNSEAERDLIMACLTSDNNNYPSINWPRVKAIMDDMGYKFTRSALDQRWSKKIMKEWRERNPPGSSGTTSPSAAMSTPSKQRNRGTNESGSARASGTKRSNAASKATATDTTMAGMDRDEDDSEEEDSYGGGAPVKAKPNAKTKGKEPAKKRRRNSGSEVKAAHAHDDLMSVPMYPGVAVVDGGDVEILTHQAANGKRGRSVDVKAEEMASKMELEDEGDEVVFQRERSCTVRPKPEDEI